MAYTFKLGQSVAKNTRRVAKSQVEKAIDEIDDSALGPHDTVHQVRKRCKKLRGLLRLVRPCFDDYKQENAAFRDIASELSFVRDSEAMVETHDHLMDFYSDLVDAPVHASVRNRLVEGMERVVEDKRLQEELARFRGALVDAKARIGDWKIDGDGFEALAGGVRKTYKRGRHAMADALDDPTPGQLHQWRKRVKYHWHHARLLSGIWPEMMEPYGNATKTLSVLLGAHHDLAVLQDALPKLLEDKPDEIETYLGLAKGRQALLESEAFCCGRRVFAEKPSGLTRRWGTYWKAWQSESEARHLLRAA